MGYSYTYFQERKQALSSKLPTSLTSQVCKLFEIITRDRVVHHLKKNMLITDSQHGFRHRCKKRSNKNKKKSENVKRDKKN